MNSGMPVKITARRPYSIVLYLLYTLAAIGIAAGAYRFGFGLRSSTNLDHYYPWGLWIIVDVTLIALAAGGFVTAALVHVLHRDRYRFLMRPALLTALVGYTFASVLLAADLGKYYNIWHPILPSMWQGNSALFEVGLCVMSYLIVLYVEFVPILCERFMSNERRPVVATICRWVHHNLERFIAAVIILGVAISCLHQSSLGHVFVLAPWKLHPLWWTPILSLLFLLSAVVAALPTVIFVYLCAARVFRFDSRIRSLAELARYVPLMISVYLAVKLGDMIIRGSYVYLTEGSLQSVMFVVEVVVGLAIPLILLLLRRVRTSPWGLMVACALVMVGVAVNRANVYWIGFEPVNAPTMYFPSLAEWAFTIGVLSTLALVWGWLARFFPVLSSTERLRSA